MDTNAPSTTAVDSADTLAAEVLQDYSKWREHRKPFEGPWFVNGAMLRGQQHVMYNDVMAKLVSPVSPTYRVKISINRIKPKIKARLAKFFKSRPKPVVIPASTERKSILDARATEKVLNYIWLKLHCEEKHKEARGWATIGSKGFWWFSWDESAYGKVSMPDALGKSSEQVAQIGDVNIEVGSPFEVLVEDPSIARLGKQPQIMRTRLMKKQDVIQRYPQLQKDDVTGGDKLSQYKDQLAVLRPQQNSAGSGASAIQMHDKDVLVIERFTAPNQKYPKGRYVVVIANQTVKQIDELPYGMWDHTDNPYPCVEFSDDSSPGQFWSPTQVEQLIDLQREYNMLRGLVVENARAMARPKIIVYKQHNLADGAWTTQAGEIISLNWLPGLPDPKIIQPANIAGDVWNLLNMIKTEFDDLTQIYPAAEGKVGDSSSGFQTNLLQEASDGVHAPDIREDELTIQEAAWKIRRLMKLGYTTQRLISTMGGNSAPEMLVFSNDQIDEYAEVKIQAGSMLPDSKAARSQMAMQMFTSGMFGDPKDPIVRRRALEMIDMGGVEVLNEDERRDEDQAQSENMVLAQGGAVKPAQFYEDHPMHIIVHSNDLKAPETQALPPNYILAKIAHLITHFDWVNPGMAQGLRQQYNLQSMPVATPPPPAPAPPPPPPLPEPPKLNVALALKGPDLGSPVVQQILSKEGLPVGALPAGPTQPPAPPAGAPPHPMPPAPAGAHPPPQAHTAPPSQPAPAARV